MKQCKFYDKESKNIHGGILMDDGNLICGECGSIIDSDEIGDGEECNYKILEIYDNWIDLSEEICGDDLYEDEDS